MTQEESIFAAALSLKTDRERQAYLDEACGDDARLHEEVEQLLRAHREAGSFLNQPAVELECPDTLDSVGLGDTAKTGDLTRAVPWMLQPCATPGRLGRLGVYEVIDVVAKGGMGSVMRAWDSKLERIVAVKIMSPEMAASPLAVKRFLREARSAAAVVHDHVVTIYSIDDSGQPPLLVMEFIEGVTLQQKIADEGALPLAEILRIGMQTSQGLAAAHAQGLIHRDVKPGNILLEDGVERVKITDFGLARAADDLEVTQTGTVAGTPQYMSPEQARGEVIDCRSDLFSLGSVLYAMCTGCPPFRAETAVGTLHRVCNDTQRPIRQVNSEIPDWLETIVARLMQKDPEKRYQTAAEVADMLGRCLAHVQNPLHVALPELGEPPTDSLPAGKVAPAAASSRRRRLLTAAVVAASLVAGLAATEIAGVTHLAATVIRLAVGEGTLVIECSDPDVKVSIDGEEVTISGAGMEEIKLRPGQYKLSAFKDGRPVPLPRELVTITRGGREVVRVTITPRGDSPQTASASGASPWRGWPADAPPPAVVPFDAGQAKQHQQAWADYLGVEVQTTNSIGMKMQLVPPGRFEMAPNYHVTIAKPFLFGTHEVTIGEFSAFVEETGYKTTAETSGNGVYISSDRAGRSEQRGAEITWRHERVYLGKNYPVGQLSWEDAVKFCEWLSQKSGKAYRLPTEAEWEWACRAGTEGTYHFGEELHELGDYAWYVDNSREQTHPVGSKKPSPWGQYDLHGNVCEHCLDYSADLPHGPVIDPHGPTEGQFRVVRGGGYRDTPHGLASRRRAAYTESASLNHFGMRVVCELEMPDASAVADRTGAEGIPWPADAPPAAIAPFDADQARAHQEAWAKYLGVPVEYTNSIGMEFVLVPPGEFLMGSTQAEIDAALKVAGDGGAWHDRIRSETPQHRVVLTRPLYLGVHEVTQAQYERVMGRNPSYFAATGANKDAVANVDTQDHPVEGVGWNDAAEFCNKLSEREKLAPFYSRSGAVVRSLKGNGYRLPTEAEWEYTCRAGTTTRFWSGDRDEDLVQAGWFLKNSNGRPHAVGERNANPFGLCDVHGNVWEWVHDGADPASYGRFRDRPAIDPVSPPSSSSQRVVRGGRWDSPAFGSRSTIRIAPAPAHRNFNIGFRVSLEVDAVKGAAREGNAPQAKPTAAWHGWPADAPPPAIAPFDAEQAKAHQEAWAKYLDVPVEHTNSVAMKFRLIPPGEFLMGSSSEDIEAALEVAGEDQRWQERIQSEGPQHKVILTQPVYVGVTEVTQAQYEQVMGTNPSDFSAGGRFKDAVAGLETQNYPVEMVCWHDAAEFSAKLSQREQLKPFDFRSGETVTPQEGTGYRLPTEAEWEYVCRAGTTTRFWSGDRHKDLLEAGWFQSNSGRRTHAAGELKANPFGLYDMHGNVWEWVQDRWDPALYAVFSEKTAVDPYSPSSAGTQRVLRGGDWYGNPSHWRSSARGALDPGHGDSYIGFRVVLPVDAVKQRPSAKPAATASQFPPGSAADLITSDEYQWTEP